jgi:4-amino-4-deoxy-L-arabinose transferase-like glycosyltransferase
VTVTAPTVPILRPAGPAPPVMRRLTRRERLALAGLLLGTAGLYLWNLGSVGWANMYYAGAVHAMSQNWRAFLFGAIDAGNIVTVDGPPASLWVMALSARLFGLSSWSMLVPQALMGVAAVALLYAAVRRAAGPGAGLVAGAALALTPAAVEMFRYNNPDALLVLLLVAAAYATVRAIEGARTGWLLLAGVLIGWAFLTKMAQAFVPLPALALAYLVAAPTGLGRRIRQLFAAGVVTVVAGGWWYAVVELWPAASRPYIGGSRTDSALELVIVNGVPVQTGPGFGSDPGPLRMIDTQNGVLISWLLPAALALLLVGLLLTSRAPRTDIRRASLLLWGGWTVVTALVFSLAQGIYHSYYTVALAPGVAAVVGIGSALLWERRWRWAGRGALALLVAGTAAWAWVLLNPTPELLPRWAIVAAVGVVIGVVLVGAAARRRGAAAVAVTFAAMALAGPAAYAGETAAAGGQGGIPGTGGTAGPSPLPGGQGQAGPPLQVGGQGGGTPSPELVNMLRSTGRTWSAATVGAQSSAALALASDTVVMGIGGFSGNDPAPTLEEFQALVAADELRYFVDGGIGPGPGAPPGQPGGDGQQQRGPSSEILTWVQESFQSTTIGDRTVYDFDRPLSPPPA